MSLFFILGHTFLHFPLFLLLSHLLLFFLLTHFPFFTPCFRLPSLPFSLPFLYTCLIFPFLFSFLSFPSPHLSQHLFPPPTPPPTRGSCHTAALPCKLNTPASGQVFSPKASSLLIPPSSLCSYSHYHVTFSDVNNPFSINSFRLSF